MSSSGASAVHGPAPGRVPGRALASPAQENRELKSGAGGPGRDFSSTVQYYSTSCAPTTVVLGIRLAPSVPHARYTSAVLWNARAHRCVQMMSKIPRRDPCQWRKMPVSYSLLGLALKRLTSMYSTFPQPAPVRAKSAVRAIASRIQLRG